MPLKRTPPGSPSHSTLLLATSRNESPIQHCESAPDLHSFAVNITERKKRKLTDSDFNISEMIKDLFSNFSKEQEHRFQDLQNTMSKLNEQNAELRKSVQLMSNKYDEFLLRISRLESEKQEDRKTIQQLEEKLELTERKSRVSGIEIRNIPKTSGESKDNLCNEIAKLGKIVNVEIDQSCIRDIYRLNTKDGTNPVIVDFTTVLTKERVLRGFKSFNKSRAKGEKLNTTHLDPQHQLRPLYVSETLTHKTHRLYYLARSFKKNYGYSFCWTSNGIVYLKKNENSSQIRIATEQDLDKIRNSD